LAVSSLWLAVVSLWLVATSGTGCPISPRTRPILTISSPFQICDVILTVEEQSRLPPHWDGYGECDESRYTLSTALRTRCCPELVAHHVLHLLDIDMVRRYLASTEGYPAYEQQQRMIHTLYPRVTARRAALAVRRGPRTRLRTRAR
ncbi:hypothetical protein B0H11DRAFT_2046851, partial [Mycena galericulata]